MLNFSKWFLILSKRLYKNKIFLFFLILIPLFTLFIGFISKEDSGFLNIGIVLERENAFSKEILANLKDSTNLIYFSEYEDKSEGLELLQAGKLKALWIFSSEAEEIIKNYSAKEGIKEPIVQVIEREDNVLLNLSREKLAATIFKTYAPYIYLDFVNTELPMLKNLSREEKLSYFEIFPKENPLFKMTTFENGDTTEKMTNYLLSPLRGFFSILIVVCGLCVVLLLLEDREKELFVWLPPRYRFFEEAGTVFLAVLYLSFFVVVSLFLVGLNVNFFREILLSVCYSVQVTAFVLLIKEFISSKKVVVLLIPFFALIMIGVCPIFFDISGLLVLQLIFPPTYYLQGIYQNRYIMYLLIYTILLFGIIFVKRKATNENFIG